MSRALRPYLESQADRVEGLLAVHRAPGRVTGGTVGPRLVRFEIAPAPHTRLAQIQALADDLALALWVPEVRISKHLGLIVLEFGRPDPQPVKWQQLLDDVGPLPIGTMLLGLTGEGRPLLARLGAPETAHVLVSGTTGAGKSVLLRTMAASLALTHQASVLGMLAIDLKNRTFPEQPQWSHLCRPVATRPETAAEALRSLVHLMEVRDKRRESTPRIAVFIDELSDLVMTVENAADMVTRLAQRGREAGLHLIAATQYPAAAILGGLMRANFPLRLVGKVVSAEDARVASGRAGTNAHLLGGRGDFIAVHTSITRFQVPLVTLEAFTQEIQTLHGQGLILEQAPEEDKALVIGRAEEDARKLLAAAQEAGRPWNSQNEAERWLCGYNGGSATYRTRAAILFIDSQESTTTTALAATIPG